MTSTPILRLILAAGAAWYVWANFRQVVPGIGPAPSDFLHYWRAAQALVSGASPYSVANFNQPPLTALVVAPLGWLDYVTARWLWFALSHLFLLAAAWLTWRRLGRDLPAAASVCVVWGFGGAAAESLGLGQVGPLLLVLLCLAHPETIAAAAALKLFPAVAAWQWRGQWKQAARFLAVAGLLYLGSFFAVPPPRTPPAGSWTGTPHLLNWSLPAIALRIADPPSFGATGLPTDWVAGNDTVINLRLPAGQKWLSLGIAFLTLSAGLFWARRWPPGPETTAALIALTLAAAPLSWTHYQLLQYPGVALLLSRAVRDRNWPGTAAVLTLAALLYPLPVAVLEHYYRAHGNAWMAHSPLLLYFWTSIPPLASLALFGLFGRRARSGIWTSIRIGLNLPSAAKS